MAQTRAGADDGDRRGGWGSGGNTRVCRRRGCRTSEMQAKVALPILAGAELVRGVSAKMAAGRWAAGGACQPPTRAATWHALAPGGATPYWAMSNAGTSACQGWHALVAHAALGKPSHLP